MAVIIIIVAGERCVFWVQTIYLVDVREYVGRALGALGIVWGCSGVCGFSWCGADHDAV